MCRKITAKGRWFCPGDEDEETQRLRPRAVDCAQETNRKRRRDYGPGPWISCKGGGGGTRSAPEICRPRMTAQGPGCRPRDEEEERGVSPPAVGRGPMLPRRPPLHRLLARVSSAGASTARRSKHTIFLAHHSDIDGNLSQNGRLASHCGGVFSWRYSNRSQGDDISTSFV